MGTESVRYHSADDMDGLAELGAIAEPVAVVIRPDDTVDAYGYVAVVDQRAAGPDFSAFPAGVDPKWQPCEECGAEPGEECRPWCTGHAAELGNEGTVRFADGSVVSLACYDERHGDCPDDHSDGSEGTGCLDGYNCECGCSGAETAVSRTRGDAGALDAIREMLRDPEWGVGMLEDIAELVKATGRDVANYPDNRPTWARH